MGILGLDAGLYANIFEVELSNTLVNLMRVEHKKYPSLRELRQKLEERDLNAYVYADGDWVYGYGSDYLVLREYSFSEVDLDLKDVPKLTCRMILDGFLKEIKNRGFEKLERKRKVEGRAKVFNFNKPIRVNEQLSVYRGFDLRSIYLFDHFEEALCFGLIVDVTYTYRDSDGNTLNFREIVERFGSDALIKVRQVQKDLSPERRANLEVSRQRLLEDIIPFIREFSRFTLPCNVEVTISDIPSRIILTDEEEWI